MRLVAAVGLAAQIVASVSEAQPLTQEGQQELSLHASLDFEGAVGDMLVFEGGYGYFFRDDLSARATMTYTVLEDVAGEDSDYRASELGLSAEYHIHAGARLLPVVGLGIGWRSSHFGPLEASDFVYGPHAGLKYFVADNVAIALVVTYRQAGSDVFINDFRAEDSDLTPSFGLRWHF